MDTVRERDVDWEVVKTVLGHSHAIFNFTDYIGVRPQSDRLETGAEMRKVTSSLRRTEGTSCRHTSNSNRQTQGLGYS